MKITRMVINNFRSIQNADIYIDPVNAIVGRNNSGKSSLLRALNAFFNFEEEKNSFENQEHSYSTKSKSSIQIDFQLNSINTELDNYVSDNKLLLKIIFEIKNSICIRKIQYKKNGKFQHDNKEECLKLIKKYIEFILIPPNRNAAALKQSQNSVLSLLIDSKMKNVTENRDNYSIKFQPAINYLNQHALKNIAKEATKEFLGGKNLEIEIKHNKFLSYTDFLPDVEILINEHGRSHDLLDCGTGVQSLAIISLYHLYGKLKKKNVIIGLEEPETNLHPQSQKELIYYFRNLVKDGHIHQLFFTTHSSELINEVEHTEVILFKKIKEEKRAFKSVIKKLPINFFQKYELEEYKYYQFHRYRNSDFFFADYVVITESKTELELIKEIGKKVDKRYYHHSLSFLNLEGVTKVEYVIHLLKDLGIPFLLIVDKDFFVGYKNDSFKDSLDSKGFPLYSCNFKNQKLIELLIPNKKDRDSLLKYITTNHTKTLDILEKYSLLTMNYCTELDLVRIASAQHHYFDRLKLKGNDRNLKKLLDCRNAIKKPENIIEVFKLLDLRSWPYSYSRIRKFMDKISKNHTK